MYSRVIFDDTGSFEVGDLVRWLEFYDAAEVIADAGVGVVVDRRISTHPPYGHHMYLIHRTSPPGLEWYSVKSLSLLAKAIKISKKNCS
jgi:hypothetical protein